MMIGLESSFDGVCTFHMLNELTFLWNELTILWDDLTIDLNDLTMERNDRKSLKKIHKVRKQLTGLENLNEISHLLVTS